MSGSREILVNKTDETPALAELTYQQKEPERFLFLGLRLIYYFILVEEKKNTFQKTEGKLETCLSITYK